MGINKTPFVICKRGEYIISETMNQIEIIGIRGVKLYVGSWSEWITDANRPVVTIKSS